jgi:hypothetical protein
MLACPVSTNRRNIQIRFRSPLVGNASCNRFSGRSLLGTVQADGEPESLRLYSALHRQYIAAHLQGFLERDMATTKTATLTFRIDPILKEALHHAAQQEHRSIANILFRDDCERQGIAIESPGETGQSGKHSA